MALSRWAGLVFLRFFAYGAWIAHNLTMQEWMAVSGHPLQLGLHWEDVTFSSRGDFVPLVGWCLPVACERRCIILIQETDHHRNDPAIQALQPGHDLVDYGFNVLLFDLRARGESGGASRSEGDREQWDLPGAIDYVVSRGVPVEVIDQISQPIFFIHGPGGPGNIGGRDRYPTPHFQQPGRPDMGDARCRTRQRLSEKPNHLRQPHCCILRNAHALNRRPRQ